MIDKLLNQYEGPTRAHYKILGLSWAGRIFDFYDLMLLSFLIIPIGVELHLSNVIHHLYCYNGCGFGHGNSVLEQYRNVQNSHLFFMFLVGFGTGFFGGYGALFTELFPTQIRNTASGSAFNLAVVCSSSPRL
ncbi:MAG TPA: hypothetical protein PL055_00985 [Methanobacterium sp.]|jgi:hypothetical protein|nr:MAG: hypothetical protein FGO69_00745 [Methanobacterium sp.]HOI71824.1 hypothetical protein [Methanobacterium sp.]HPX77322.1 hypothetical protein [Methanobacterium sp.]